MIGTLKVPSMSVVSKRILVVEDEEALADSVRYHLEREGYEVYASADGANALMQARSVDPDLVLLDVMLPGMHGFDVLRAIRTTSNVPIIMVTAKDSESDVVAGLELGADDYVTKPFSMPELLSRVGANLRRVVAVGVDDMADEILTGGRVRLDIGRHVCEIEGAEVALRPKEFALLEALMRRQGRLSSRDDLIAEVWGYDYFGDTKTLDVHIKRIRGKIEVDPKNPTHILTVRGVGYKYAEESEWPSG